MCTIFTATSPSLPPTSSSDRNISQQHGTRPCVGNIPSKAVKTNYEKLFNIEMKYSAAGNRSAILQRATPKCLLTNKIFELDLFAVISQLGRTWRVGVSVWVCVISGQIDNTRQYRIGIKLVSAISIPRANPCELTNDQKKTHFLYERALCCKWERECHLCIFSRELLFEMVFARAIWVVNANNVLFSRCHCRFLVLVFPFLFLFINI